MENKNKGKGIAAVGVAATLAASGVVAGNVDSRKVGRSAVESTVGYVDTIDPQQAEDIQTKGDEYVNDVVGTPEVSSTDIDSKSLETTTAAFDNSAPMTYTTASVNNVSNLTSTVSNNGVVGNNVGNNYTDTNNIAVSISVGTNNNVQSDDKDNAELNDYDCYSLMQDAIGNSLRSFTSQYSSLSEALESNGFELSDKQRARYDTVVQDTYEIYKKGIAAYESGDKDAFRKICDEVLNTKKYLNLNDYVDILALNINLQGNYVKDSSNYSISEDKLIIDGITVENLFNNNDIIERSNPMSLISFYAKNGEKRSNVLDIMQVPIFILVQASKPANLTIMDSDNTVYVYDNDILKQKFADIKEAYKLSGNDFGSSSNSLDRYYSIMNSYYRESEHCRVGYFSGKSMKEFLGMVENGVENVKVPESIPCVQEYIDYLSINDTIGFVFNGYNVGHSNLSLSEAIESNYGVKLSDAQRARYDTLITDTYNAYQKGLDAYKAGKVSEFRKICEDIVVNKKYMNRDDLVDIMSLNINTQGDIIKNPKNYSISDGKVVIDGITIDKLFDYDEFAAGIGALQSYTDSNINDYNLLDIMRVPKAILMEAINPSSYSLVVDGNIYAYSNSKLKQKVDSVNTYFSSNLGLNNLGYEQAADGSAVFYGFDNESNKQFIDNNNEYIRDLSIYLGTVYPSYEKSINGRVGYFDGFSMKSYLNELEAKQNNMTK